MYLLLDTDILVSYVTEALGSLNKAVEALPVWEIDLSEIQATLQELTESLRESNDSIKGIQPYCSEAPVLAFSTCIEDHPLMQTLLIMTIHFRSDRQENNSHQYKSLNYSTINRIHYGYKRKD